MYVQIRGTSGSGKTTSLLNFVYSYGSMPHENRVSPSNSQVVWQPYYEKPRRTPLWYQYDDIYVLGSYTSNYGGLDTIKKRGLLQHVLSMIPSDAFVVCEGLLMSEDVKKTVEELVDYHEVRNVFLTTSLDECVKCASERSTGVWEFNPTTTVNRYKTIERARHRLAKIPLPTWRRSRNQVPRTIERFYQEHKLNKLEI